MRSPSHHGEAQTLPKPGTAIRAVYDRLLAVPGPVNLSDVPSLAPKLYVLRARYGLDVQHGPGGYTLKAPG